MKWQHCNDIALQGSCAMYHMMCSSIRLQTGSRLLVPGTPHTPSHVVGNERVNPFVFKNRLFPRSFPRPTQTMGPGNKKTITRHAHYEWYADGGLFKRFISNNGRNGHLKSVEAFVPSRFVNKAALMTTNCLGAVTHTERRFQCRLIYRRSQQVLNCFSFHLSGLTGFHRRPKASIRLLTNWNSICVSLKVSDCIWTLVCYEPYDAISLLSLPQVFYIYLYPSGSPFYICICVEFTFLCTHVFLWRNLASLAVPDVVHVYIYWGYPSMYIYVSG